MKKAIPEIMVESVSQSIEFYKNILGFEVTMKAPDNDSPVWALIKNDEAEIMLYQRSEFESEIPKNKGVPIGGTFLMYIKVDNIENIYNSIKGKVKMVFDLHQTPYGSKEMAFEDNSGYIITLSQD